MQFGAVFTPVAAATIVNAILSWFAWRGAVIERRTGRPPWQLELGLVTYLAALGTIFYLLKDARIGTTVDLFCVAFAGEGMGVLVAYMLAQAFVTMRGQPWQKRSFPMAAAIFLTVAFIGGVFTS